MVLYILDQYSLDTSGCTCTTTCNHRVNIYPIHCTMMVIKINKSLSK